MKILLIDDDPFALRLLGVQLANAGHFDVTAFDQPELALAAVKSMASTIDLVFCDLQMPRIDGVEFIRHLVARGYAGALVLMSGEDRRILQTVERLASAHKLRIVGSLSKPISASQLDALLQRAADRPAATKARVQEPCSEHDLRGALTRGELINHYQPKVDLISGSVVGVETLVRWSHPQLGIVFPDRFVGTAERHGLIGQLTVAVLRSSLRQMRLWLDDGIFMQLAVNISMDSLNELDFPDFVAREAASEGVPLTNLVLEVTESRLMADPLASLDILTRLRLKQIGLSIDDFGTGHSSLAQLRDIPFDELKVDRGFVHGAHQDPSLRAIVTSSVGMSRQMGIRSVAEGIEDENDFQYARAAGFDVAQGYFVGRPMNAKELPNWIANWNERRAALFAAKAGFNRWNFDSAANDSTINVIPQTVRPR